jgi:hypothetical protein
MLGRTTSRLARWLAAAALAAVLQLFGAATARAHCDALDGPVVTDARAALASGSVSRVLKWVRRSDEAEVREAFAKAVKVRALGADAREMADRYFFETLVRLHRAAEGEPYKGLAPPGADPGPAARSVDEALAKGKADALIRETTEQVARAIRKRFSRTKEKRKHKDHSVVQGRQYVAAYLELVHYIERIHHAGRFTIPDRAPSKRPSTGKPVGTGKKVAERAR